VHIVIAPGSPLLLQFSIDEGELTGGNIYIAGIEGDMVFQNRIYEFDFAPLPT